MNINKIEKIATSLLLNYKSWILLFIAIYLLPHTHSFFLSYLTYFIMLFLAYFSYTSLNLRLLENLVQAMKDSLLFYCEQTLN